mmetsp:Transcript_29421/g.53805  ORF Transcript_29421/g.53805 Transcript_29421/m.53805 type:complete len:460 (-) Transcript_29421:72-1451(-)
MITVFSTLPFLFSIQLGCEAALPGEDDVSSFLQVTLRTEPHLDRAKPWLATNDLRSQSPHGQIQFHNPQQKTIKDLMMKMKASILGVAGLQSNSRAADSAANVVSNWPVDQMYPASSGSQNVAWWTPKSSASSFAMACVAPLGWAVLRLCAKAASDRGVAHSDFFLDFIISIFVWSFLFFLLPGRMQIGQKALSSINGMLAATAGAVSVVGNLLLTSSISSVGLTASGSICQAITLACGAAMTYFVDQRGCVTCLRDAVGLSICAGAASMLAVRWGTQSQQGSPRHKSSEVPAETASSNVLTILRRLFISGLLLGAWSPLSAESMTGPEALSPYASFLLFSIGFCVVGCLSLQVQSLRTKAKKGTSLDVYIAQPLDAHMWGLVAGLTWSLATQAFCLSGKGVGFSVAFTVGNAASMFTGLVGLVYYKDFRHSCLAMFLSILSIVLYLSGVLVLAFPDIW